MLPYKLSNGPNDNFTNNSNSWKIFQKTSKQKLCRKRRFWNVSPIASDHNIDEKLQSNPKHSFQQQSGSRKKFGRKRLSYLNHVKVVDQPSSIDKVFTPNDSSLLPFCNQAVNNKEDVSGCVSSSESSFKTQKRCTKVQSCSGLMNSLSNGGRSASSSLVNLFKSFSSIKKDSCVNVKPSQNSIDDEDVIVIPNNSSDFCLTAADMKHCVESKSNFGRFNIFLFFFYIIFQYDDISIKLQADSNILASLEAGQGNCLPYVLAPLLLSCKSGG